MPRHAVSEISIALTLGATLQARGFTAGPLGAGLFACTDKDQNPVVELEVEQVTVPFFTKDGKAIPALSHFLEEERRDFTAFGAARAFVKKVGDRSALAALDRARKAAA